MSKKMTDEQLEQAAIEEFGEEHGREPDAQELHDWMNRNRGEVSPTSKGRLKVLLAQKGSAAFDPIESAMINNPGLTRERAEAMAREAGF